LLEHTAGDPCPTLRFTAMIGAWWTGMMEPR
jgi:hypothetical protein